ncbi:hypothetical protein FS749_015091 [Ceratobasidium sp. UAMH 11750]|nr:hypothetical protein FS749_015091 [Ceratobasidium sp. UAMH 11750]
MELWAGNERVDQLISLDAQCDVFLVLGPRLRSKGAAQMVKSLAKEVHQRGGMVVHVDQKTPQPNVWGEYFDLHIEMDADMWAKYCYYRTQPKTSHSHRQVPEAAFAQEVFLLTYHLICCIAEYSPLSDVNAAELLA